MKTEIANILLRITLPETSPKRESFVIWVNTNHATWGFETATKTFFNKNDLDYITKGVNETCAFARALESL